MTELDRLRRLAWRSGFFLDDRETTGEYFISVIEIPANPLRNCMRCGSFSEQGFKNLERILLDCLKRRRDRDMYTKARSELIQARWDARREKRLLRDAVETVAEGKTRSRL